MEQELPWNVSNLYGSRQSRDSLVSWSSMLVFRVVSNLYGSRQSRDTLAPFNYFLAYILFPIYMDPDRVGTQTVIHATGEVTMCFQFIWIPTESGLGSSWLGWYHDGPFPIYMDPDRVGTTGDLKLYLTGLGFQFIWIPTESGLTGKTLQVFGDNYVSNLYGSRQSRDKLNLDTAKQISYVSNLYGSRQSRDQQSEKGGK